LVPAKVRFASVVAVAAKWLRSSDETAPSWAGWRAERPGRFPIRPRVERKCAAGRHRTRCP
jgi:hypothetical protein